MHNNNMINPHLNRQAYIQTDTKCAKYINICNIYHASTCTIIHNNHEFDNIYKKFKYALMISRSLESNLTKQ